MLAAKIPINVCSKEISSTAIIGHPVLETYVVPPSENLLSYSISVKTIHPQTCPWLELRSSGPSDSSNDFISESP